MLLLRRTVFFLLLFAGLSLHAQQNCFTSSYVQGNFCNRGRISVESSRTSDDLIFLDARPDKDRSLSFKNPRIFENGKEVISWEELMKSVHADVRGIRTKLRPDAAGGEWEATVADEVVRVAFTRNTEKTLEKNKPDGIDLDFEWAEAGKEYEDYSLTILGMREVLGDRYTFSVSLHPVCYKISRETIVVVDFTSYQCYGPPPIRFPTEKYCSDIQMVLAYGIPKERLVADAPFHGATKDSLKKTGAYFSFMQDGLITGLAQNEVTYKGDVYVFDGQSNIHAKTRYAMNQQLKGMMSWDLATDVPLNDSGSLFKTTVEELGR